MKLKTIKSQLSDIVSLLDVDLNASLEGDHLAYILEQTQKLQCSIDSIETSDLRDVASREG